MIEREIAARVDCGDDFVEERGIGRDRLAHFARDDRLAGLVPIVHGDREEDRAARRQHREVIGARDGRGNVFGAERLVGPLYVGLHDLDGAADEERLGENLAAVLLAGGDDERSLAEMRVDERGKAVAGAGDRVEIHEGGFVAREGVAEGHAGGDAFVQAEDVLEAGRHVLEERQLARTGIAEDGGHPKIAEHFVGGFSYRGHRCGPPPENCAKNPWVNI